MASFSGFIRRSPANRLKAFLEARGLGPPADFDWASEGRSTAFMRSIEALLAEMPSTKQDAIQAELELLAELSNDNGMMGAAQICAGQGIDLEGFEGIEDILLMLATVQPRLVDRVLVQTSFLQKNGGRQWARFQFPDDGKAWSLDEPSARDQFLSDTVEILNLPDHRKREADWFHSVRVDPATGEETQLTQATIYIQEHAQSELAFGEDSLERHTVQKVLEVGLACDPKARIVEICAKGGHKVRDKYLEAFAKHFAPQSKPPVEVPRRDVELEILRDSPSLETVPADGVERVEVSSLSFRSSDGGFLRVEKRGEHETLYAFLERRFGAASPLRSSGWKILSTTLRIMLRPKEKKKGRILTITLSTPNRTSVPNRNEAERQLVYQLLERWGLLGQQPSTAELFEVVE